MSVVLGVLILLSGVVTGAMLLLLYVLLRMMRNGGWDDSNLTNALRLLSHVCLHPEDFGMMYYPSGKRPFWYVSKDELSEVVKSRPDDGQ